MDSQRNRTNIHKRVFLLSVKLRNLALKLPLEAASSMEPGLTQVMRDEGCNRCFNGVAPITGIRF